jgi:hypothetical protein
VSCSSSTTSALSARVRILDRVPDGALDLLHGHAEHLHARFPGCLSPLVPVETLQFFEVRPGALGFSTHVCARLRTLRSVPSRPRQPQKSTRGVARGHRVGHEDRRRACFGFYVFPVSQQSTADCWNSANGACGFARVVEKGRQPTRGSRGESWREIDPTMTRNHVLAILM